MVYALINHRSGAKMLKIQGKRLQSLTIFDVIYLAVFSVFGEGAGKKHARKKKKK